MNLLDLPFEILERITLAIDHSPTFHNWACSCKFLAYISQLLSQKKMLQFVKQIIDEDERHIYEYCILPNGDKIGEHKVWLYPLEHDENPDILPVLMSHTWLGNDGTEVKAYWTSGRCKLFQDWFHYPVDQLMTEHKTYSSE